MKQSKLYLAVGTALLLAAAPGWIIAQTPETQPNAQAQPEIQTDTAAPAAQTDSTTTLDQEQPKVTVEQSDEPPKVTIEQSDEPPKVTVEQADDPTAPSQSQDMGGQMDNPLYAMTADELEGRRINNMQGEKLGDIDNIVIDSQDNSLKAVVSVGGFLGIGDKDIVVSLDQMQVGEDGNLMLATDMTEDQLKESPEYSEDMFQEVEEGDVALSQLQGGGTTAADTAQFETEETEPPASTTEPPAGMTEPPASTTTTQ